MSESWSPSRGGLRGHRGRKGELLRFPSRRSASNPPACARASDDRAGHGGPPHEVAHIVERPLRTRLQDRPDLGIRDPMDILQRQPDPVGDIRNGNLVGTLVGTLGKRRDARGRGDARASTRWRQVGRGRGEPGRRRAQTSSPGAPRPPQVIHLHLFDHVFGLAEVDVEREDRDTVAPRVFQDQAAGVHAGVVGEEAGDEVCGVVGLEPGRDWYVGTAKAAAWALQNPKLANWATSSQVSRGGSRSTPRPTAFSRKSAASSGSSVLVVEVAADVVGVGEV